MPETDIKKGFKKAREITRKFAKTFYLASLFLPQEKKYASYAIYAICRLSDETVDDPGARGEEGLRALEARINGAYSGSGSNEELLEAFRLVAGKYAIPKEYFSLLIEGMRMDLSVRRYADYPSLDKYCYRAAGVVGLIMLKIFGYDDSRAEGYAVKMGNAMQITNILRDIKEDLGRGRIYLPQDEMRRFGVHALPPSGEAEEKGFCEFMRFQVARCRELYREAAKGIKLISCPACRFVALCMYKLYAGILDEIEKNSYRVFKGRAYVANARKAHIIFNIILKREYL
ncbi:MAG: phytoene/squalene synthase family protein [Candidatus Omnitrophica bacterium]|nr:phytoene/squalene synthase family protein [Candidatus Omnitrophota bacterium]MDD5501081.1 phytoene/squalene synthase family protein [Candidatus Omnitrophota bacterium]